jgi:2-desacetyl-2-hydroxyethyl bacteriochlorophyllide A dehydrogenase
MMTKKATAVLIRDDPRRVEHGEVDVSTPGPGEVLVRAKIVGICRSDIELRDGHLDGQLAIPYPVVPGHEWSGEVADVGPDVTNVGPRDRVVGECVMAPNHWFGFSYHGAASTHFIAPANLLHRLPAGLSYEQGAMVEPFTIAYHAIFKSGSCDGGDIVAITGAGMIGQCALSVTRSMGAFTVVIEPSPRRRELAEKMGADLVLDPGSDVNAVRRALDEQTGSEGADLVIEASGSAPGLASTFELARHAGRITVIGIVSSPSIQAPLNLIQAKDLRIRGVTGSTGVWPRALRFLARHQIDLSPLVSATYGFPEADVAFGAAEDTDTNVKIHLRP